MLAETEELIAQTSSNKAPKVTLTENEYFEKKNELQQALRNNSIISQGPTNPGRFISLLRDVLQLNYQNITRDNFNTLIKDMDHAYQECSAVGCPYQYQTFAALTYILKFIAEAFSEEFIILELNNRFSALNFKWQPKNPEKNSFFKSFADVCCCFFPFLKSRQDDGSLNRSNDEKKPLLTTQRRNGF